MHELALPACINHYCRLIAPRPAIMNYNVTASGLKLVALATCSTSRTVREVASALIYAYGHMDATAGKGLIVWNRPTWGPRGVGTVVRYCSVVRQLPLSGAKSFLVPTRQ